MKVLVFPVAPPKSVLRNVWLSILIYSNMKVQRSISLALLLILAGCGSPEKSAEQFSEFANVSQVENGRAVNVMLTAYSTTLLANGTDITKLRIALTDSLGREITSASDSLRIYVKGDGNVVFPDGSPLQTATDTSGTEYGIAMLRNGICHLLFVAGTEPDRVNVEAMATDCWPGGHEIHTLPADFNLMNPEPGQLAPTTKPIGRMIGADISWVPEMEARGRIIYENGQEVDAVRLLKNHGFNYIRLRIFVNPENEKGYSPGKGYCGLDSTLAMARRVKDAGMDLLLDFHYSDYWADPQKQFKPLAWEGLDYPDLCDTLKNYTAGVINAFKNEGLTPAMVQVGNEINHGIVWPDGHVGNPDGLAGLLKAGVAGVREADPEIPVMMHVALGGQNDESVFWFDNMIARGVEFDIIGLSYYPRWHGTLDDLKANLYDLNKRYRKPLNVVEYSQFKKEVHDIVFGLPDDMGKGACIWEPLSWMSAIVDRGGNVNSMIEVYDVLSRKYLAEEN